MWFSITDNLAISTINNKPFRLDLNCALAKI